MNTQGIKTIFRYVGVVGFVACSSTTITGFDGPIILSGTYTGFQDGTIGTLAFEDDPFELSLIHDGDSVTGSWITTVGGVGTVAGVVLPSDSLFQFTLELTQTQPCAGTFVGTAEARSGIQANGQRTIGIVGNYAGDDCDNTTDAAFFVLRVN